MNKVIWLGHSAFQLELGDKTIFIDPWINPNSAEVYSSAEDIKKADLVFVTHDHNDHGFEDGVQICKNTNATFVGVFELALKAGSLGVPNIAPGNIGGEVKVGDVTVYFAPALHSSGIGAPCGYIINRGGFTVYFTGDTAFFSDMSFLSRLYDIDLMILPICSNFMMGFREALWAMEHVKPKVSIPCHYDVFPGIKADPDEFKKFVGGKFPIKILTVGETWSFDTAQPI